MKGSIAAAACLLFANSACIHYQPRALNPLQSETQLRTLNLNSPGLAQFVRAQAANPALTWPPAKLTPDTLTYIAYFFNPDLEVARAKAAAAAAAVVTARQRINPSLSGDGGRNRTPDSIATYSVSAAFTIETAGKRGYRILQAEKQAEAARIAVFESAWAVRNRMRSALIGAWAASTRLDMLNEERKLRDEVDGILEKRLSLGEASGPERRTSEEALASLEVTVRNAQGALSQSIAAVAAAAGVPVAALAAFTIDFDAFDKPAPFDALPLARTQQAGLLHRADVRRSLVEYGAADAGLRLALANQYPNIALGPSYSFQEGFPAYVLSSALEALPLFHHNQGPIEEREAALTELGAEFRTLQSRIIGDTEAALRRYQSATEEWLKARDTLLPLAERREASVTAAFRAGDADRLELTRARIATLTEKRSTFDALERAQQALGVLENAVEAPLGAGIPAPAPEKTN